MDKIASIQSAAINKAKAQATGVQHPHSPENWHSPGDLGLLGTLLIVAFVFGSIFLVAYVGNQQGWFGSAKGKGKGKYEVLPTKMNAD